MPLLNDDAMVEKAEQRASFRLTNVSSKLSRSEAERLDLLARKCGQQRGEFIRHLILDELTRDSGAPTASPELSGAGARVGPLGGVDLSSGVGVGGGSVGLEQTTGGTDKRDKGRIGGMAIGLGAWSGGGWSRGIDFLEVYSCGK